MALIKPNKRILILCEGVTEYLYAQSLRMELPRELQRIFSIEISFTTKNDPKNLATEAKEKKLKAKKERNPFDSMWLFFDHDNWPQLKDAFEIIQQEKFEIAYSSICIEHWFILHYENCGKAFQNGEEALKYLQKKWPEYHKTKIKHYEILKSRLDGAIKRAEELRRKYDNTSIIYQRNPFITIDKLVEFFQDLTKKK